MMLFWTSLGGLSCIPSTGLRDIYLGAQRIEVAVPLKAGTRARVTQAYQGYTSHRHFQRFAIDIAIPEMDGFSLFERVGEISPNIIVIFVTGSPEVEQIHRAMKLGALDFLIKPCETEILLAKISWAHEKKSEHEERIRAAKVSDIISSPRSVLDE